jgi:hypothetical protein
LFGHAAKFRRASISMLPSPLADIRPRRIDYL